MAPPGTPTELLDWLVRNQFLPPERGQELRSQLAAFPDNHALCREFLKRDWLTAFQVNQLLQGKGESLIYGPNRVLNRLGEGAMGTVYKAWNVRLGKLVALKTIQKEHVAKEQAMKRFRREIETASQLDHPNIVLVRDADEANGSPYLAMDFVDGIDLAKRVKQDGPLPIPVAVECARQAALGLQHAYERGVVHRDIKPSNLLVAKAVTPEQPLVVKILDFGLARFASEQDNENRLTQFNKILGTVDYIAPEQIDNARGADTRSDIYSLGCTLYYLLVGKPAFPGHDLVSKLTARISGPQPRIREVRPEAPEGLEEVMLKVMARLPDDRYQTPREVAAALAPFARPADEAKPARSGQVMPANPLAPATAVPTARVLTAVPVSAPIPLASAQPIQAAAAPMPAMAPTTVHGDDSLGFGDTTAASVSNSRPARSSFEAFPAKPAMLLGGAAMTVIGLVLMVRAFGCSGNGPKKDEYPPGASLRLLPVESKVYVEGGSKRIVIELERKKFSGPVKVQFENLPPGLTSKAIEVPSDRNHSDELRLTVSYGTPPFEQQLRITATAKNLSDETLMDFTLKRSGQ